MADDGKEASSSAAGRGTGSGKKPVYHDKPRIMGLNDLRREAGDDRSMYAGGEKSGMAIEGVDDPANPQARMIRSILEQAAKGGTGHGSEDEQEGGEEEEGRRTKPFQGRPQRLRDGQSCTPTPTDDGEKETLKRKPGKVTRTLTFWRNGFTVAEGGPLFEYHVPENQQLLGLLQAGHAPLSLLQVEPGQSVDVRVLHRMGEDFDPAASSEARTTGGSSTLKVFAGKGQRLGDLAEPSSSSKAQIMTQRTPAGQPTIDPSQPTTTLQLRFANGTRMNATFNTSNTVADLFSFVQTSSEAGSRTFSLLFGRPPTSLDPSDARSLQDLNLLNTVVMQQWK